MPARRSSDLLDRTPILIGMVHLEPLPGSPEARVPTRRTAGPGTWMHHAVRDALTLAAAGFDAVLVENYGDAPFFRDRVCPATTAGLAIGCAAVREALPATVRVGVNVLRNGAQAAVSIAAAAGLDFVRVNVLAGAAVTDQGVIEGHAAQVLRLRARIAPRVRILADLRVKHARPLVERPIEEEARELVERAGADAVIVSGVATGSQVDPAELRTVRASVGAHRVLIGSGADARTVGDLLRHADGVIVGTSIKRGGRTTAPVDARRARAFVEAARAH